MLTRYDSNNDGRGEVWGTYLDHAPDAALADLELCELVYASPTQARALWSDRSDALEHAPVALVCSLDGDHARLVGIPMPPPSVHSDVLVARSELHARIASSIRAAAIPDTKRFEVLATLVLGAAPGPRETCEKELAKRMRARLASEAPSGARWAKSVGGCGEVRSGTEVLRTSSGPCGTGFIGPDAERFLWLYIRAPATVVR